MKWISSGLLGGALLAGGCSDPPPEVPFAELEERFHRKDDKEPFTGIAVTTGANGQTAFKAQYVDGQAHGLVTQWYANGKKQYEIAFRRGKQHGIERWWYSTGKRMTEASYKEGVMVEGTSWDPGGTPTGRVEKGDGILTAYHENGNRSIRTTFKNGTYVQRETWNPDGTLVSTERP